MRKMISSLAAVAALLIFSVSAQAFALPHVAGKLEVNGGVTVARTSPYALNNSGTSFVNNFNGLDPTVSATNSKSASGGIDFRTNDLYNFKRVGFGAMIGYQYLAHLTGMVSTKNGFVDPRNPSFSVYAHNNVNLDETAQAAYLAATVDTNYKGFNVYAFGGPSINWIKFDNTSNSNVVISDGPQSIIQPLGANASTGYKPVIGGMFGGGVQHGRFGVRVADYVVPGGSLHTGFKYNFITTSLVIQLN